MLALMARYSTQIVNLLIQLCYLNVRWLGLGSVNRVSLISLDSMCDRDNCVRYEKHFITAIFEQNSISDTVCASSYLLLTASSHVPDSDSNREWERERERDWKRKHEDNIEMEEEEQPCSGAVGSTMCFRQPVRAAWWITMFAPCPCHLPYCIFTVLPLTHHLLQMPGRPPIDWVLTRSRKSTLKGESVTVYLYL